MFNGFDETDRYIVEWDEEELSFTFKNIGKNSYMALGDMYDEDWGEYSIEVIGNIYDNKDLLKE